jgi:hypothetical protein
MGFGADAAPLESIQRPAPRFLTIRQCFPEHTSARPQGFALAAINAIEFRLSEQCADFWLAAGGKKSQSIKRTRQRALLDELGAALTEPAGQLHAWIVVGAHKAEATRGRPF